MYFTIANTDPALQSILDAVHLVALFFDDLKKLSQVCMSLINIVALIVAIAIMLFIQ